MWISLNQYGWWKCFGFFYLKIYFAQTADLNRHMARLMNWKKVLCFHGNGRSSGSGYSSSIPVFHFQSLNILKLLSHTEYIESTLHFITQVSSYNPNVTIYIYPLLCPVTVCCNGPNIPSGINFILS